MRAHSAIESAFFNEIKRQASVGLHQVSMNSKNAEEEQVLKGIAGTLASGNKAKCKRCLKKSRFMLLRRPHFQDELER